MHYSPDEACVGKRAINKSTTDPKNVFYDAKRLLAERINSPKINEFTPTWSFKVVGYPEEATGEAYFVSDNEKERNLISSERVSSDILKSLLENACEYLKAENEDMEVVITVPAYFNINQKRATIKAAEVAGIKVKQILSEPVAAALAYQLELRGDKKLQKGESVFIFDLGGGTFDVTIMRIEEDGTYKVIALGGDTHLGGRDFDQVIADIIEERLRKQLGDDKVNELMSKPKYRCRLIDFAHDIRESFTQVTSEDLPLDEICPGVENEELKRSEFEERARHLQDKIKECCESTLRDSGINSKDINHVLLVGGASRMNLVENILKKIFPIEKTFLKTVSGDEAIAIGATFYAARFLDSSRSSPIETLKIEDALPLSIGIEFEKKFKTILENNLPFPVRNKFEWKTTEDNQTSATIPVWLSFYNYFKKITFRYMRGYPKILTKILTLEILR